MLQKLALSRDSSPSRGNFAFVDSSLKRNRTLFAEFTAVKQSKPVRIVLTPKDAHHVYSESDLSELCETTYSLAIDSEPPNDGDKLAIRIRSDGAVCISQNNCGWIERTHVDADLEYHVVFDLEHISVLSMIGMTIDGDDAVVKQLEAPPKPSLEVRSVSSTECIVCLENARTTALIPCYHFALCEDCANTLRQSGAANCPLCRVGITDVKKIYMA